MNQIILAGKAKIALPAIFLKSFTGILFKGNVIDCRKFFSLLALSRTFTVAKPKNPHKSRYICVYGDFFIFWYVDMHACVCLFSRRGEYLLTQAHPECR